MTAAVITSQFSVTGVPLAQIRLANSLAQKGYSVNLIFGNAPLGTEIDALDGVAVHLWSYRRALFMLPRLIAFFRRDRPEIVFAAEDNTNAVVLLAARIARSSAMISVSSRIAPNTVYSDTLFSRPWVFKQFVKSVMGRADVWTCVSKDLAEIYAEIFPGKTFHAVYNIIDQEAFRTRLAEPVDHPWLQDEWANVCVTAGTLHSRKGLQYLIPAIGLLRDRGIDARLIILGDGPQADDLQRMVREHDLKDRVWFEGPVSNPLKYFLHSNVYVLASLQEGMPNVLIEGMLAGCTPVATDCPTGPREILENGKYGYLVPMRDAQALAGGIERALERPITHE